MLQVVASREFHRFVCIILTTSTHYNNECTLYLRKRNATQHWTSLQMQPKAKACTVASFTSHIVWQVLLRWLVNKLQMCHSLIKQNVSLRRYKTLDRSLDQQSKLNLSKSKRTGWEHQRTPAELLVTSKDAKMLLKWANALQGKASREERTDEKKIRRRWRQGRSMVTDSGERRPLNAYSHKAGRSTTRRFIRCEHCNQDTASHLPHISHLQATRPQKV